MPAAGEMMLIDWINQGVWRKQKEQVGKQKETLIKGLSVYQGVGTTKEESMKDAAAVSGAGNSSVTFPCADLSWPASRTQKELPGMRQAGDTKNNKLSLLTHCLLIFPCGYSLKIILLGPRAE